MKGQISNWCQHSSIALSSGRRGEIHYSQLVTVLFYKFFKLFCPVLGCSIHYKGYFVAQFQQSFDKFERYWTAEFLFLQKILAQIRYCAVDYLPRMISKTSLQYFLARGRPWTALWNSHAAVLFNSLHTSQSRPVLRTKSAASRIFATVPSLCRLPCFCVQNQVPLE